MNQPVEKKDVFIKFVEGVAPKLGGPQAFSLFRDCTRDALVDLLVAKGVFSRDEWDKSVEKKADEMIKNIAKMPVPSPLQRM